MTDIEGGGAQSAATRRVLLACTGLSPQVITETIYALSRPPTPWIPTEVQLVTTRTGADRARLLLLSDRPGWFRRLLADYGLPAIEFSAESIHVVTDPQGTPLDDIRTAADNQAVADFLMRRVRAITADPDSELHVSIAGGRKTMGFYLGYSLSLFGRAGDRLSHVLVSDPFENNWDFFYPTPYSAVIQGANNEPVDCQDAQVSLAHIPFVRLRDELDDELLESATSFDQTVAGVTAALSSPSLTLDLRRCRVRAGNVKFRLQPSLMAFLVLFARRCQEGAPPVGAPPKDVPDAEWAKAYLDAYRLLHDHARDLERTERALRRGMTGDNFSVYKSRLHRALREHLGRDARRYEISDGGTRPRRYSLDLPGRAVRFGDVEGPW